MMANSTLHGLSHYFSTERLLIRLMWVVIFLVSFAGCSYTIFTAVADYLNYDVITVTELKPEVIFPAVTLCRKSPILLSMVSDCQFKTTIDCKSMLDSITIKNNNKQAVNCIRFNAFKADNKSELRKVNGIGITNGLLLRIENKLLPLEQMEVYVEDNYLNDYSESIPVIAEPMFTSEIQILKDLVVNLPNPYNDCKEIDDPSYRRLNCLDSCTQKEVNSKYNCSIQSFYENKNLARCTNTNLTNLFLKDCSAMCPQECNITSYTLFNSKLTRIIFSDKNKINIASPLSKPVYILIPEQSTEYELKIFYNDLNHIELTQVPKTSLSDIVSNVGGTTGLFLGASFMTFIELFGFIFEFIFLECDN